MPSRFSIIVTQSDEVKSNIILQCKKSNKGNKTWYPDPPAVLLNKTNYKIIGETIHIEIVKYPVNMLSK